MRVNGRVALIAPAVLGMAFAVVHPGANTIKGHVFGGGAPVAQSTVTLWEAGAGAPRKLAETKTKDDGAFEVVAKAPGADAIQYVLATGGEPKASKLNADNPAIALMTVIGGKPPARVVVNEMTTVASVWTHTQLLDRAAIKGEALSLRIAAGNVPNFVDVTTGGWGDAIQNSLNSSQTPTMANFATLADVLAGCVTKVTADACDRLFAAAKPPSGSAPADTLAAAELIARYPWYEPERLFALMDVFYPIQTGKIMRAAPFTPYLNFAPSAWVLPLEFDGGGFRAGGKAMFDSEGNLWVGSNFTVGWQAQDVLWQGNAAKFAPNGKPLSPMTTGFFGGGFSGGTFGAAVDANDNVWLTSYAGHSISKFDKNGKSLAGPDGITFNGQLGLMQGVIVTPSTDVWVLGLSKNQLVYIPKGDPSRAKLICEGFKVEPCKSFVGPFHLGIDQHDRIWVTNAFADFVARFPAADPSKVETFKAGFSGSGLGIDSQGNVWVTNRLGNSTRGGAVVEDVIKTLKTGGNGDEVLVRAMAKQTSADGGSVTLFRPDGTQYPGSPFTGGGLPGPWAVAVDGNDNIWISNFAMPNSPIVQLCGARTENCPPGMKTGDQISPPGGYVGGGLQMQTDIAVDPAGNVWAMNNWQNIDSCFGKPPRGALSTRCGGQGVTVFYGMAKPVRAPQIGPTRPF